MPFSLIVKYIFKFNYVHLNLFLIVQYKTMAQVPISVIVKYFNF